MLLQMSDVKIIAFTVRKNEIQRSTKELTQKNKFTLEKIKCGSELRIFFLNLGIGMEANVDRCISFFNLKALNLHMISSMSTPIR